MVGEYGLTECIKMLIEKGADVNTQDIFSETSLHKAARKGDDKCVQTLSAYQTDINAKNVTGQTALHTAAREGHGHCIRALLACGADINAMENGVALNNYKTCVDILLQNNIDTKLGGRSGVFPAEKLAKMYGHSEIEEMITGHNFKNTKRAR